MTRYAFRQALGAFFLAETGAIRPFLPQPLMPLEARPGHGILAVTAFDFVESEVGSYGELVFSVLVSPFATPTEELPLVAAFPFVLCTTTPASRAHAAERWYLPQHDRCLDIRFDESPEARRVQVLDEGAPVLELSVGRSQQAPSVRLYQFFSARNARLYRADIHIEGILDEHEEELGQLVLHEHPLAANISGMITDDTPLREQSMHTGEQRFRTLVQHGARP